MQQCKKVAASHCRQRVSLEQQVADLKSRLGSEVYARQAEKRKLLEVRYYAFCETKLRHQDTIDLYNLPEADRIFSCLPSLNAMGHSWRNEKYSMSMTPIFSQLGSFWS